jgi:hypothetical protein
MADRVSASIVIGGAVSGDQYQALCALIRDECLCTEWDGDLFTPEQLVDGESLSLYAHEVPWGCFNALEQYCCNNAIAYHRWSGACPGSFGAERIIFDGKRGPFNYDADEDDRVVLTAETIDQLGSIRAIRAYLKPASFEVPALRIAPG